MPGAARLLAALVAVSPAACTAPLQVDGARAHARVVRQVEAGPRIPGSPGHRAVREWLVAELGRLGARVEEQAFVDSIPGRRLDLVNVVARFGPAEGRPILLCAHWDTRPTCDEDPDPARRADPVPGANDGGSGVAVLLEVAELMSRRAPRRAVSLVFFDGEDQGRAAQPLEFSRGAREYVRRLHAEVEAGRGPVAAFVFDMVGDRDLQIHPELQSHQRAANLVALVTEAARATGARHFHPAPRFGLTDDHVPLLDGGVPAVLVIDFDYPAWHTHRDLPEQVSPASLAEVARVAAWIVYRSPLARP